jgi:hypothetical protein
LIAADRATACQRSTSVPQMPRQRIARKSSVQEKRVETGRRSKRQKLPESAAVSAGRGVAMGGHESRAKHPCFNPRPPFRAGVSAIISFFQFRLVHPTARRAGVLTILYRLVRFGHPTWRPIVKLSISEVRKQLPALVRRVQRGAGARVQITVHDQGGGGTSDSPAGTGARSGGQGIAEFDEQVLETPWSNPSNFVACQKSICRALTLTILA